MSHYCLDLWLQKSCFALRGILLLIAEDFYIKWYEIAGCVVVDLILIRIANCQKNNSNQDVFETELSGSGRLLIKKPI